MATAHSVTGQDFVRLDQTKVSQYFGCDTFNEQTMRERLPKDVFKAFKHCLKKGTPLTPEVAKGVAQAIHTKSPEEEGEPC